MTAIVNYYVLITRCHPKLKAISPQLCVSVHNPGCTHRPCAYKHTPAAPRPSFFLGTACTTDIVKQIRFVSQGTLPYPSFLLMNCPAFFVSRWSRWKRKRNDNKQHARITHRKYIVLTTTTASLIATSRNMFPVRLMFAQDFAFIYFVSHQVSVHRLARLSQWCATWRKALISRSNNGQSSGVGMEVTPKKKYCFSIANPQRWSHTSLPRPSIHGSYGGGCWLVSSQEPPPGISWRLIPRSLS